LFGVCSLAFGMMIGTVPTSVPQFILLGNWLLEMDFKRKWHVLKSNKIFWILSAVFLIHIVGLIHTSDAGGGWDAVRTKMPLMFLALIFFSTKPLALKEFHFLLYCFILGSFINTAWCYTYTFLLHKNEVVRSASRFMSHIRLGLYLNLAISVCVYFIITQKTLLKRIAFVLLILYFLFSMYALGLASGITNLFILSLLGICYLILKQNIKIKLMLFSVLVTGFFLAGNYIYKVYASQIVLNTSGVNLHAEKTAAGRLYYHFDSSSQKENGNLVHINIQLEEIKREWNRRSPADSFSYKPIENINRFQVLTRYLTSKSLKKDSVGVWSLTENELKNIQNNITNYRMPEWSYLHKRTYELVNEYDELMNKRNINGHSLSMRIYFWKAAVHLIKNNFLFGVGSGDVQNELNNAYKETNTPLSEEWYKRPHNQFLTITVALGIFGLIIFIISLIAPLILYRKYLHVLYWPFIVMAVISFSFEDTLETQAGLTFYAFFNTLFISMAYYKKKQIQQ